jgi:hypothetical protein
VVELYSDFRKQKLFNKGRDHLIIVILTILTILTIDFQINIKKNRIFLMNIFFYLQIDDSNFMQLYYHLILHQKPSNYNRCKLYKFLIVLNGLSNDNEIA